MESTWPRLAPSMLVGEPQDGDHERDVGLDRRDDVARRRAVLGDQRQQAVARLGERREAPRAPRTPRSGACRGPRCGRPTTHAGGRRRGRDAASRRWRRSAGGSSFGRSSTGHRAGIRDPHRHSLGRYCSVDGTVGPHALSAASIRRSVSSRPSTRNVSKIPGETVVPASATRTAGRPLAASRPRCSTTPRSAASTLLDVHGSARRRAPRARRASRSRRRRRAEHLLARGGIVGRPVEEETRQRPELGQRRDLLLRDLGRVGAGRRGPVSVLEPRREVVERELAQVAAVHVAQLLLVEHGGRPRDALEREPLDELVGGEELLDSSSCPSPAARRSCAPPRAGSRRRAAPARTRRRGAWRASCRRARGAAARARRAAAPRPSPRGSASAWACWSRWSAPRTTWVIPASRSSTTTARW